MVLSILLVVFLPKLLLSLLDFLFLNLYFLSPLALFPPLAQSGSSPLSLFSLQVGQRQQPSSARWPQPLCASRSTDSAAVGCFAASAAAGTPPLLPPSRCDGGVPLAGGEGKGGGQRAEAALDPPQPPVHGVTVGREPLVRCALHFGDGEQTFRGALHGATASPEPRVEGALDGLGDVAGDVRHDGAEGLALRLLRLARALIITVLPDLHLGDSDIEVALVDVHGGIDSGGVCLAGGVVGGARNSAA
jgi:hypothetical protein